MASELDPRGVEPEALFAAADFLDARVLEIGAGDGRLTFRYGEATRLSVGIDPAVKDIARAVAACPVDLRRRVSFLPAGALALPFRDGAFDIALLAWSL
jgi:ubiquinone/menaquinone biosynthesis C-methylase UbiE